MTCREYFLHHIFKFTVNLKNCHMTGTFVIRNEIIIFNVKNDYIILDPKNTCHTTFPI